MFNNLLSETNVARQSIGSTQDDEVLVPIGLPNNLGVPSYSEVSIINIRRKAHRRCTVDRVLVIPADLVPEAMIFEIEKVESILHEALSPFDHSEPTLVENGGSVFV